MRRIYFGLLLAIFAGSLSAQNIDATSVPVEPKAAELDPALPTLFVAGDSTAARNGNPKIQGWAEPFAQFFEASKVNIANRARGGRSSRTFITEGHWAKLLAELKAGDVVLIQFGHNDSGAINREPEGSTRPLRARGSLPGLGDETEEIDNAVTGQHEVVRTYGSYIREMVADVQAKGATPILLSLTVRDRWADGKIERFSGDYRVWTRQLAADLGIGFVDLTRLVADTYQALGEAGSKTFFTADYVHTNEEGALVNAAMVLSGLKGLRRGKVSLDGWLSKVGEGVAADQIGWLNLPEPANPELPTIFLIGDSTVRNGGGDGGGGQWGWGEPLAELLDASKVNLVNRAIGGLSSRTFVTQGHWDRAKALMKAGDLLLIQFGHNDAAPLTDDRRARGTIRTAGHETQAVYNLLTHGVEVVQTYGDYLRDFVREAKALGVKPVICSPVPRKKWDEATGKLSRGGSYVEIAAQVAHELDVPFIDLNSLVADRYDGLGPAAVEGLFADPNTHTSRAGAELTAGIVADALKRIRGE